MAEHMITESYNQYHHRKFKWANALFIGGISFILISFITIGMNNSYSEISETSISSTYIFLFLVVGVLMIYIGYKLRKKVKKGFKVR